MLAASPQIHCLRDATRGGLAAVFNELASASNIGIEFDERQIPVRPEVHAACEMLGLDPFYVANEGSWWRWFPPQSRNRFSGDALASLRQRRRASVRLWTIIMVWLWLAPPSAARAW